MQTLFKISLKCCVFLFGQFLINGYNATLNKDQNRGVCYFATSIDWFQIFLRHIFQKSKPRIMGYKSYKHFDNNKLRYKLIRGLSSNTRSDLSNVQVFLKKIRYLWKRGISVISKLQKVVKNNFELFHVI